MKGIQAGAHLHFFHLVYRFAGGIDNTALIQRQLSIGEGIFYDEILAFLRIHKGGHIGVFGGDNRIQAVDMVLFQRRLHGRIRTGSDFVNHGPGEGHFAFIIDIGEETVGNKPVFLPGPGKRIDGGIQLIPIVGTIVHAHQCDGKGALLEAFINKGNHLSEIAFGSGGTRLVIRGDVRKQLPFAVYQAVALFRDGKAGHFQGRGAENFLQASVFRFILAVQDQGLHNTSHHGFFHATVRL